jgi:hypothetical protein
MYGCFAVLRKNGITTVLGKVRYFNRARHGEYSTSARLYAELRSQKDLMLSMAACFPVYGSEAVEERGTELWEGIKTEVCHLSV